MAPRPHQGSGVAAGAGAGSAPPTQPAPRPRLRTLLLVAVAAVVLTALAGILLARRGGANLLTVGGAAPAVDLLGAGPLYRDAVALAQSTGRPMLVEFFEVGCPHCQAMAPRVCALLGEHPSLEVVAVDAARETQADVTRFRQEHLGACASSARLQTLADPCRAGSAATSTSGCGNVTERWRVTAVPTVYVVVGGRIAFAGSGEGAADAAAGAIRDATPPAGSATPSRSVAAGG